MPTEDLTNILTVISTSVPSPEATEFIDPAAVHQGTLYLAVCLLPHESDRGGERGRERELDGYKFKNCFENGHFRNIKFDFEKHSTDL